MGNLMLFFKLHEVHSKEGENCFSFRFVTILIKISCSR